MKRSVIAGAVVLAALLAGFVAVQAQNAPRPPDPLEGAQQALGLSATQVDAVRALLRVRDEALRAAQEDVRGRRQTLAEIQRQPAPNSSDLGNAMQALQEAQRSMAAIHDKYVLDFEALLNADQKALLESTRAAALRLQALSRLGVIGARPEFGPGGPRGGGPAGGGPRGGGPMGRGRLPGNR